MYADEGRNGCAGMRDVEELAASLKCVRVVVAFFSFDICLYISVARSFATSRQAAR
jgi:hypothetical protein